MCAAPSFVVMVLFRLNMKSFLCNLVLAARLVDRYYKVYKAHALEHLENNKIILHLGYPFVNYDFADADADGLFKESFDEHVQLQEEYYLVDHEKSKYHGNLKGKHLRLALNFQNILNAFVPDMTVEGWNRKISSTSLRAALLVGTCQDAVSNFFTNFAKVRLQSSIDLQNQTPRALPSPGKSGATRSTSYGGGSFQSRFDNVFSMSAQDFFETTAEPIRVIARAFALKILAMRTVWLDSTKLRSHIFLRDAEPQNEAQRDEVVVHSMVLLKHLQFGFYGLSTNTSGRKHLYFYKRERPVLQPDLAMFLEVLKSVNMDNTEFYAPTETALKQYSKEQKNLPMPNLPLPAYECAAVGALIPYLRTWGVPRTISASS